MEGRAKGKGRTATAERSLTQVPLYSKAGKEIGEVSLNKEIFGARVNQRLLQIVEKGFASNQRQGNASTKTRGDVRGGGKKPWKQKGTGRARHGSSRSPIWKGGGVAFGPHPRDYSVFIPNGMKKAALISALSLRAKEGNVILLEDTSLKQPKTKEFVKILNALPLESKRTLCVIKESDANFKRATQNLSGVLRVELARDVNAYQVLRWPKIVIEQDALGALESRLFPEKKEALI